MSWLKPHAAAIAGLVAAFALTGCGFRPLYAPRGLEDWNPDLAAISVSPIPNRPGQILELALREDLNPGGLSVSPRWQLNTHLNVYRRDLGIQSNAVATSSEITVTASYTLVNVKTGKTVYNSSSRAIGDFNQLNDAYATQVAAADAQDRALHEVADEIAIRMALFVRQQRANSSNS